MPRDIRNAAQRPRISVDVDPEIRRRIRLAAAKRDVSVRQYITDALQERLREDLGEYEERLTALTATADPVLATLWDNEKEAAYDHL
jgi:hypothetical protein